MPFSYLYFCAAEPSFKFKSRKLGYGDTVIQDSQKQFYHGQKGDDQSFGLKPPKREKFVKRDNKSQPPVDAPYVPPKPQRTTKAMLDKTIEIFEGMTIDELAKRTGKPTSTLQTILTNVGEKADSEFDTLSIDIAELVAMEVGVNVRRLHSNEDICGCQRSRRHYSACWCFCLYDMLIERPRYTALVAEKLSSLHVPEEAQAAVIYKLFQLVETAYPLISISVDVYEVTVRFFGGATSRPEELLARSLCATRLMRLISDEDEHKMMDLLYAKKSSYEPRLRLIPAATNSCIEEGEAQPQLRNMLLMSAGGILTTSACFALRMIETKLKINISDSLLYFMSLVAMYASKFW